MQQPDQFRLDGLPRAVTVYEVGPRDGLQNEPGQVPTAVKIEFIERLVRAGTGVVEVTSVVHPKWVPQLADAEDVMSALDLGGEVRMPVLVPNARGLDRALAHGAREVAVFVSATETFSRRNLNRTMAESIDMVTPVIERAVAAGVRVRGYVSMCFGDPWEGPVDPAQVVGTGAALLERGCAELSLGDTIGVATPGHVEALLARFAADGVGVDRLAVHFHDTYGQALSNAMTALRAGVTIFDASAGGLGGCPFAKSATGNLATEDLLWMLAGLGIETGIDLPALIDTSLWMSGHLGRPSASRVVRALAGESGRAA